MSVNWICWNASQWKRDVTCAWVLPSFVSVQMCLQPFSFSVSCSIWTKSSEIPNVQKLLNSWWSRYIYISLPCRDINWMNSKAKGGPAEIAGGSGCSRRHRFGEPRTIILSFNYRYFFIWTNTVNTETSFVLPCLALPQKKQAVCWTTSGMNWRRPRCLAELHASCYMFIGHWNFLLQIEPVSQHQKTIGMSRLTQETPGTFGWQRGCDAVPWPDGESLLLKCRF